MSAFVGVAGLGDSAYGMGWMRHRPGAKAAGEETGRKTTSYPNVINKLLRPAAGENKWFAAGMMKEKMAGSTSAAGRFVAAAFENLDDFCYMFRTRRNAVERCFRRCGSAESHRFSSCPLRVDRIWTTRWFASCGDVRMGKAPTARMLSARHVSRARQPIMPRLYLFTLLVLLPLSGGCPDSAQPPVDGTSAPLESRSPATTETAHQNEAASTEDPAVVTALEEAGIKLTRNSAGQITGADASEVAGGLNDEQLALLTALKHLTNVNLDYSQVTNDGLAQIASIPTIKVLSLRRCGNINDAGLVHLTQFPELEQLSLLYNSSSITDDGMVPLGEITTLRLLDLRGCTQIGDAGLAHLAGLSNLVDLKVQSGAIGDEGVASLSGMTKLRNLALEKTRVTNDGLAALEPLTEVQALNLYSTPVDDDGLVHLAGMTKLKDVKLRDTATQGTGLVHLHPAKESLWRLDLSETFMTDEGLANVSALTNLESLNLWYTGVTDAGLPHLTGLGRLKDLNLEKCDVGDEGLSEIAKLTALETLNLTNTNVTDEGLKTLEPLTNLKTLQLGNTQVSDEAVQAFTKAVPGCKVEQ